MHGSAKGASEKTVRDLIPPEENVKSVRREAEVVGGRLPPVSCYVGLLQLSTSVRCSNAMQKRAADQVRADAVAAPVGFVYAERQREGRQQNRKEMISAGVPADAHKSPVRETKRAGGGCEAASARPWAG